MKKFIIGIGVVAVLLIAFFIVKPRIAESKFEKAEALFKQKKYELAIDGYTSSIAWSGKAQYYNARGLAYEALKKDAEALADFLKATEKDDAAAAYWANLGGAQRRLGKADDALTSVNKSIKLD